MSYLISGGEMSQAEKVRRRQQAVNDGKARLAKLLNQSPTNMIARDADYAADFMTVAQAVGASGWLSMPLAVINTQYSVFASATPVAALAPIVPNNRLWVFFGVHLLDVANNVSQMYFFTGTSLIRKANFDLEKLYSKLETDGYFSQDVVYDPQEVLTCTVLSRIAAGVGSRVVLDALVIEPSQVTQV